MRFEESRDESRCDKDIKRIESCRECVFEVLCRLDKNNQTLFFNKRP